MDNLDPILTATARILHFMLLDLPRQSACEGHVGKSFTHQHVELLLLHRL